MRKAAVRNSIERIIDANINRAKEGLRVCEEIIRFTLQDHDLTADFKKIRHKINSLAKDLSGDKGFIESRNSLKDTGKNIYINEFKRKDIRDIFFANIQRVKESIRVIEEFSKLVNITLARGFKKVRYGTYELEKKAAKRISALCNHR